MPSVRVKEQFAGGRKILVAKMVDEEQVHAREGSEAKGRVAKWDGDAVRFLAGGAKCVEVEEEGFGEEIARIALKRGGIDSSIRKVGEGDPFARGRSPIAMGKVIDK
jgi:hypothetical protein